MSLFLRSLLLHWLLSQAGRPFAASSDCGEPDPVANAYRRWEGGVISTWVNYTCMDGYDHIGGDLERQCSGGVYLGVPPICLLNCGPPLNYTHSIPHVNGTMSEQYANYTCIGNTNPTNDENLLFCDPAPGRWESPVYCAERETILDRISFLPLSTNGSQGESTSDAGDPSGVAATDSIHSTANSIFINSDTATASASVTASTSASTSASASATETAAAAAAATIVATAAATARTALSTATVSNNPSDKSTSTYLYTSEYVSDLYPSSNDITSSSFPVSSPPLQTTVPLISAVSDLGSTPASDSYVAGSLYDMSLMSFSTIHTGSLTNYLSVDSAPVLNGVTWSLEPSSVVLVMSSTDNNETCPRQNRLVVHLDGGPYEILEVVLVRPQGEDLYNFKMDVFSPSSACYSASKLDSEDRTTISCNGDRLFPIGRKIVVHGSDPDHGTLKICDVEVYGRTPSVDCGIPDPYPGRHVNFTTTSLDSKAIYYCVDGYHYRGGDQWVNCGSEGFWENYGLYCSDQEKLEPTVTTVTSEPIWTDNKIGTCSSANGTSTKLTFDLGGKYEVKMVTITTPANTTAASLTVIISRDELNKTCEDLSSPVYVHPTGEVTVAIGCDTAPVGDTLDLDITGISESICEIKVFGRPYTGESVECLQTSKGPEFKGAVNMTVTGLACEMWPQTSMNLDNFPDMTWDEAWNYCRNPNGRSHPWCYTDVASNSWQYCPIVKCDYICLRYPDGSTYRGSTSSTKQGQSCMSWGDSAVQFKRRALFPDNSASHSKCRNPISSMRWPWCYINNGLDYGYCSIPTCPKVSEYSSSYFLLDHVGVLRNLTDLSFTECYIWKKSYNSASRLGSGTDLESHVIASCGHTFSLNMTLLCSVPTDNVTAWEYATVECVNCGIPSVPDDMTVNYTSTFFPSKATYRCAPGYVVKDGTGNFTCLGTGQWDNATLECIVDCGVPPRIIGTHDTIIYTETVMDSLAQYTCLVTNETSNVTCQSTGTWEKPVWNVTCLVDCRPPPNLPNMNVAFNMTLTNDTATYECINGYVTTGGTGNVVCQESSGDWSAPTLVCSVDCGPPPTLTNMSVNYTTTLFDDVAVYKCFDGYQATLGSGDAVCQSSGDWSTPNLTCTEIIEESSSTSSIDSSSSEVLAVSFGSTSTPLSSSSTSHSTSISTAAISSSSSGSSPSSSTSSSSSSSSFSTTSYISSIISSSSSASTSPPSSILTPSTSVSFSSTKVPSITSPLPDTPSSALTSSSSSSVPGLSSISVTSSLTTSTPQSSCIPLCLCGNNDSEDKAKLDLITKQIREKLLLDENTLSKTKRQRVSASDSRPSAQALGHSAWIMLVAMFGVLFISDIMDMVRGVVSIVKRSKRFTSRFAW